MYNGFEEQTNDWDIRAEQAFLGAIFLDNGLIHETQVRREFFYKTHKFELHGKLFATMKDLASKDRAIDLVTVGERLKFDPDALSQIGGFAYIAEIAASVPNTKNFEHYSNIIIEKYKTREMKALGLAMSQGMDELEVDKQFQRIVELGKVAKKRSRKEVLVELYDRITSPKPEMTGAMSHLRDLDKMLNGFHRGEFVVVGARPSMGKTALAINIATNAAESPSNPGGAAVGIFAAEQPQEQLFQRAIAKEGHILLEKLRMGVESFDSGENDYVKFSQGLGSVGQMNLEIFDKPGMDMSYIRKEARELRKMNKEQDIIIIIDYLQMIRGNPIHKGNRTAEVGDIAQECKLIARELDCTVIGLAQLSRGLEQRQDKRPMMSDLRDSGEIEQAADVILFLYRDEYYNAETDQPNMLEIIVAKQREGPTGKVLVAFVKEYGKLVSLDY